MDAPGASIQTSQLLRMANRAKGLRGEDRLKNPNIAAKVDQITPALPGLRTITQWPSLPPRVREVFRKRQDGHLSMMIRGFPPWTGLKVSPKSLPTLDNGTGQDRIYNYYIMAG